MSKLVRMREYGHDDEAPSYVMVNPEHVAALTQTDYGRGYTCVSVICPAGHSNISLRGPMELVASRLGFEIVE